jgi:NADPH:quinone reductase-like Zn-dependent oxidoreductase
MQSYWMQMTDTDTVLDLRNTPVPQPGPGQLLVRIHAAALNRGEFVLGHGLHGKPGTWKAIGGEGAGEVVAVGDGVAGFKPGDPVMGRCAGAFSEYALMELAEVIAMPKSLSWEEAASIPMTFLVSYDMLVLQGRLKAGDWLLINGVSSGVGVASLQLGKVLGAKVIGTSRSPAKLALLSIRPAPR